MRKKMFKWTLLVCMLFLLFQSVLIVNADDDDDDERHDYKRYEKYERNDDWKEKDYKWKDDDDDDDDEDYWEDKKGHSPNPANQIQPSFWNVWTRDTSISLTENLPFQEAKEVLVALNGKSESLYVVPLNGQLFVSGEKMARFLGLESKIYKQSRILEIANDEDELIVRAGSNAAYENMVKTPMPGKAFYYEKSVYLPISVITNAFSYRVNWDETTGNITLESIN